MVSLFHELSSSASSGSRLAVVRSIKNKLIGSELNKRVVLSQELDLVLLQLLRDLVDEDHSASDDLRLELMAALASLAAHHTEGAERLLQHGDFLALVMHAVRGGVRGMQEAGVRALRHLVSSCSEQRREGVAQQVLRHVDVITVLVQAVRQWQSPVSDLAAEVVVHLCTCLEHRLCLIQHGLLSAVFGHLTAKRSSSASFSVPMHFLLSLRILSALCHDNAYLVLFLCSPPLSTTSPFAALSVTAFSLFPFCSTLLLHSDPNIRLHSSSLLLCAALTRLSLSRAGQHGQGQSWVLEEEERWKTSELIRLHRDFHASPIGKRGRGGNEKSGRKLRDGDNDRVLFPLHQWIALLRPALVAALAAHSEPASSAVQLLSSLLPRVLHVLTRLMESTDLELVACVYPLLTAAVDGNDACQEEVGQVLPVVLQHLLQLSSVSSLSAPSPFSLDSLLRLLHALAAHESNRRVMLSTAEYSSCLVRAMSRGSKSSPMVVSSVLRIISRLVDSHRFHLCEGLVGSSVLQEVLGHVLDGDALIASSAMMCLASLLTPHTGVRGALLRLLTPEVTSAVFSYARSPSSLSTSPTVRDDDGTGALLSAARATCRSAAIGVLSSWCARAEAAVHHTVIKGTRRVEGGGWHGGGDAERTVRALQRPRARQAARGHCLRARGGANAQRLDAATGEGRARRTPSSTSPSPSSRAPISPP